ncbi:hypothetical protein NESM_000833300 [Novymonas esmeraldas]|uniref:Uncharacterized protein n=1 Tax=Novymonas esmeraldas TaxID=1808958 RepID=A0AAW0F051_9TRYP
MPPKKNAFVYSIDPELYARTRAPASTIAMGMKSSQASSLCWAAQVRREEHLCDQWKTTYDLEHRLETRSTDAVERTRARDAARHDAYLSSELNPEVYAILYKKAPLTSTVPDAATTAAAASSSSAAAGAPAGAGTAGATAAETAAVTETSGAPADSAFAASTRSTTQAYLQARCSRRTLQQRFPDGPATAAQAVGWAAGSSSSGSDSASALAASSAPYRQVRRRQMGAYRKPEDEEHALLCGYDYTPK